MKFVDGARVWTTAQSTLDADLTEFYANLPNYLMLFVIATALVVGIAGAIALSHFLIKAIVNNVFRGGSL